MSDVPSLNFEDSEGSEVPVANFQIDKVSDEGKPEKAKKWPISRPRPLLWVTGNNQGWHLNEGR